MGPTWLNFLKPPFICKGPGGGNAVAFPGSQGKETENRPDPPKKGIRLSSRPFFFYFLLFGTRCPRHKHKYAFPFYSSPLPRFQKNTTPLTTHQPNHTTKSRKTTKTHLFSPLLFLFFRSKLLQMASSSAQGSGYDFSFKILLIGDSGVGKSSLLVSFISNAVDDPSPTIGIS